jgi:hypothetical protein
VLKIGVSPVFPMVFAGETPARTRGDACAPLQTGLRLVLAIVTVMALAVPAAHARLGEKQSYIEARYGNPVGKAQPTSPYEEVYAYRCEKYRVTVIFVNGRSVCERYTKANRVAEFTTKELGVLLTANMGESEWERKKGPNGIDRLWVRKDGKAHALYRPLQMPAELWVISSDYEALVEDVRDSKAMKGLERF